MTHDPEPPSYILDPELDLDQNGGGGDGGGGGGGTIDISYDFAPTPEPGGGGGPGGGPGLSPDLQDPVGAPPAFVLGNPEDHRLDLFIASSR